MQAWLRWLAGAGLALSLASGMLAGVKRYPPRELDVNMMFVPSPTLVRATATGYENLLADSLWLTLLQYYGDRYFSKDNTMVNLEEMFALITSLDPHFWFAYWLGAWALGDNGQSDAALRLLERGEAANPEDINYPYLQGFIRFLTKGDPAGAAVCFERAQTKPRVEWPDQRRFARTMAARMYQQQGKDRLALQIWTNLRDQATDRTLRAIADRNVRRIEAELQGRRPPAYRKRLH